MRGKSNSVQGRTRRIALRRWQWFAVVIVPIAAVMTTNSAVAQERDPSVRNGRRSGERPGPQRERPEPEPITDWPEWIEADRQLVAAGARFMELDGERLKLLEEFGRARKRYNPDDPSPRAYAAMTGLMERYHKLIGEFRSVQDTSWRVGYNAYASKEELVPMLRSGIEHLRKVKREGGGSERLPKQRIDPVIARLNRWIDGLEQSGRRGHYAFLLKVFGEDLGAALLFSYGGGRTRPPYSSRGRRGADASGEPLDERGRLAQRLGRLEREHRRYREFIKRGDEQMKEIRAKIEKIDAAKAPADSESPEAKALELRPLTSENPDQPNEPI